MSDITLSTQDMREMILNTPAKMEDIATPLWPKLDGHLALRDIPSDQVHALEHVRQKSAAEYMAALFIKALVNKHTGEQVFSDTDRGSVAALPVTVSNPLYMQLKDFLGIGDDAVANAKKN